MKTWKTIIYSFSILGFVALLYITVRASGTINVLDGASALWADDWFKATIVDFYNNQLLIFFWVAYKEKSTPLLFLYFILSICFGSFFSIGYVFIHLLREQNIKHVICKTKRAL